MQTLHTLHFPVAAMLLLSIVSCSSNTETDQKSARLTDDGSLQSEIAINTATTRENLTQVTPGSINESMGSSEADTTQLLNSSNYEQIAKSVVSAINLSELNAERDNARALLSELSESGWAVAAGEISLPGLTLASQEGVSNDFGRGDYSQTFTCDEGGMLAVELKDFSDGPIYQQHASFDNCHLNGQVHNGSLESSGARRAPDLTIFTNYTRSSSGRSLTITGQHEHSLPFFGNAESNTWKNTSLALTDSSGTLEIDHLNWREQGLDGRQQDNIQGFVMLPDGTIQRVVQFEYAAELQADFSFTPVQLSGESLIVGVNLGYQSKYFNWEGHHQSGFDLPTFPVADLGDTIDVFSEYDIHTGTSQLFDSMPKDPAPQWQDGDIRITATDLTSILMTPDSTNVDAVLIELNGSGEQASRLWSQGYQVDCPVNVGDCG